MCMLPSKLPGVMRDKWVTVVMNVRRKERKEATLKDFIGFIKEETDLVNDPLFSKGAIGQQYQEEKCIKNEHPKKRLSSYAVKSKKDQKENQ